MSKILINCLGDATELTQAAKLIASLRETYVGANLHLLCYENQRDIAETLANLDKCHYINKAKIVQILGSKIYNDAFAINKIYQDLDECLNVKWDKIINITNSEFETLISSAMSSEEVVGKRSLSANQYTFNNDWANLKVYSTRLDNTPIHNIDMLHKMSNCQRGFQWQILYINPEFDAMAATNFQRIRSQLENSSSTKIIAISLPGVVASSKVRESLAESIDNLLHSQSYYPLLLSRGTEAETTIVNELNAQFNNSLLTITCTKEATLPVLRHIDCIIGKNDPFVMLADTIGIKTVKLQDQSRATRHFATTQGSLSIHVDSEHTFHDDVSRALNMMFDTTLDIFSEKRANKIYECLVDEYGVFYTQVSGHVDVQSELSYHVGRAYVHAILGDSLNTDLINHLMAHTDKETMVRFADDIKEELTTTVKILLACLRSLKTIKQSKDSRKNFVQSLEHLIKLQYESKLVAYPIALFEGRLDTIQSTNQDENINTIEKYLYSLKNDIQQLASILERLVKDEATQIRRQEVL